MTERSPEDIAYEKWIFTIRTNKPINKGSYGLIYPATAFCLGTEVPILAKKAVQSQDAKQMLEFEQQTLQTLTSQYKHNLFFPRFAYYNEDEETLFFEHIQAQDYETPEHIAYRTTQLFQHLENSNHNQKLIQKKLHIMSMLLQFGAITRALIAAKKLGYIYGDVKPAHFLVSKDINTSQRPVVILDWGVTYPSDSTDIYNIAGNKEYTSRYLSNPEEQLVYGLAKMLFQSCTNITFSEYWDNGHTDIDSKEEQRSFTIIKTLRKLYNSGTDDIKEQDGDRLINLIFEQFLIINDDGSQQGENSLENFFQQLETMYHCLHEDINELQTPQPPSNSKVPQTNKLNPQVVYDYESEKLHEQTYSRPQRKDRKITIPLIEKIINALKGR